MKVFISWSGEPSRSIAQALDGWLERVVQHVDAWMSGEDIGSGTRWSDAVARSLEDTDFGVVCVTRENQSAPWLLFEAGALAKSVLKAKVVPLCIDLPPSDLAWPLAAFQGRPLDEAGMRRLVHDISAASEKPMSKEMLDDVFNALWPKLAAAIDDAVEGAPLSQEPQRPAGDMLAELIDGVRRIERYIFSLPTPPNDPVSPVAAIPEQAENLDLTTALKASVEAAKARQEDAKRRRSMPDQG